MKTLAALLAIAAVRVWAQNDPGSEVRALYGKGAFQEAVNLAQQLSEESADILFYHGLALARLAKMDRAAQVLERGRARYPLDPRFPLELAGVAYRNKDRASARRYLHQGLRLAPTDAYGNGFLANLYLLEGNVEAALKYWNRIDKPLIQTVTLDPVPSLDSVLRERAVAISAGQVFTRRRLQTTEANLDRLGIFATRQFDLAPRADQRFDLTLRLTEISSPLSGWLGRLLPLARGLPYETLHIDRFNVAQKGINVTALARWDRNKRRAAFTVAAPLRQDPRYRYRLVMDARDETWDLTTTFLSNPGGLNNLSLRKFEGGGDLTFALKPNLDWTTGLRISRRQFRNGGGSPLFADGWIYFLRNELASSLFSWPERRVRVDGSAVLDTGRAVLGGATRYAKAQGGLSASWYPQAKGDVWTFQARLRSGGAFGAAPFDEFFQLGVERDNELWLRGHAGAKDGRKGSAPLGTRYTLLQTEVDRTVFTMPFVRVKAGPFFDLGWIATPGGTFGSRGWLPDAGVQAKVLTLGGVKWSVVYGRDLKGGHGVIYTAVSR